MANEEKQDEVKPNSPVQQLIDERHEKLKEEGMLPTSKKPWGLALSGGGIRSATFCYGLISALAENRVFGKIDLMSTVSGGGYVGSMVGRLAMAKGSSQALQDELGAKGATANHRSWLRANSRYLTPQGSRDQLYGLVVFLRNLAGVHLELGLLAVVLACALGAFDIVVWWSVNTSFTQAPLEDWIRHPAFWQVMAFVPTLWLLLPVPLIWAAAAIAWYWYVPIVCKDNKKLDRSSHRATLQLSRAVKVAAAILVLGGVDIVAWRLAQDPAHLFPLGALFATILAVLRLVLPMLQQVNGSAGDIFRQRMPFILDMAGRFGLVVLLIFWTSIVHAFATTQVWVLGGPITQLDYIGALISLAAAGSICSVLIVLSGRNVNFLNRSSLHNFYRSRLTRAYLGAANPERTANSKVTEVHDKDDVLFKDYQPHRYGGPVHIVNVCVNQTYQRKGLHNVDRQGDLMSIIGGAGYCRVSGAGWVPVAEPALATLGTWMAISGAAASPGMGALTKPGYAAMLTTLGVRLGYWWNSHNSTLTQSWSDTYFGKYKGLLGELFASFAGKSNRIQYLSDGGHAENTGAYALIQERCKLIILADCGADPEYKFQDLENLIRRARIDLDVDIRFVLPRENHDGIFGTLDDLISREGHACLAVARVIYPDDNTPSVLVLVKPNMVSGLAEDVYNYSRDFPVFPQESTADQFFDEAQWESYFSLGNHLGNLLKGDLLEGLEASIGNNDWLESPELKCKRTPQRIVGKSVAAASLGLGAIITSASGIWVALDSPDETLSPNALFKSLYTAYGSLSLTAKNDEAKKAIGDMAAQLLMAWQTLRANDEDQLFLRNAETLDMLRKTYALCTQLKDELAACNTLNTVFVCPQKPDESARSMNDGYWARDESAVTKLDQAKNSRTYCGEQELPEISVATTASTGDLTYTATTHSASNPASGDASERDKLMEQMTAVRKQMEASHRAVSLKPSLAIPQTGALVESPIAPSPPLLEETPPPSPAAAIEDASAPTPTEEPTPIPGDSVTIEAHDTTMEPTDSTQADSTVCSEHVIFIQIYGPEDRDKARAFRSIWQAKGASVPPIEDVVSTAYQQKRSAPKPYEQPTIIYHRDDAKKCAKSLKNTPLPASHWQLMQLSQRLTGAPRTIEVWLPPSAFERDLTQPAAVE
ncbi:hypothetical protein [Pseudomonas sp. SID14000]|uniref:hypothetical protein n=1 Tax=Pseudomonas sp. SID14000 TaxID=1986221 RepID=UPI000B3CDBC6|nr:hypothetical protein [Pseudomonas sp. SID14000]